MSHRLYVVVFSGLLGLTLLAGCGGSSTPEATSQDEVSAFLDANPELKEPKEVVGYSDPRNP